MLCAQSCLTLCDPLDYRPQAPLSIGFSRQGYWSGLPFPPTGDLPDPQIEPRSLALVGRVFTTEPPGNSKKDIELANKHMKRCSELLVIREMQITMRCYYYILDDLKCKKTPTTTNQNCLNQVLTRIRSNWNSHTLLMGMLNYTTAWETVWQFFIKLNLCLPYDMTQEHHP